MSLFLGYEKGTAKEVSIPVFHTLITGQTRLSGKTTTLKGLARQVVKLNYKVLIIDSKTNFQDYENFGDEVPVCLQESTDSLILMQLLESIFRRKLTPYYATLTRIAEDAKNFDDIIFNAEALKLKSNNGFVKDACVALIDLLKRLKAQTKVVQTTPKLTLPYSINRMTIGRKGDFPGFDLQSQQLIVKTVFDQALKTCEKLIIILDEAGKFLPQKYSSCCSQSALNFVTQGGATGLFLWMGTQFLAVTNKEAMKTMAIKLLGTQDHVTECQHTLELIPFSTFSTDDIMRLGLGHFITVIKDPQLGEWVKTVYAVPEYADKNECKQVALGMRRPADIHLSAEVKVTAEEMKRIEEIIRARGNKPLQPVAVIPTVMIQKELPAPVPPGTAQTEPIQKELRKADVKEKKNIKEIKENTANITDLKSEIAELRGRVSTLEENFTGLQDHIRSVRLNGTVPPGAEIEIREHEIAVKSGQPDVKMVTIDDTPRGKLLILAREGFFDTHQGLKEVMRACEDHRWNVPYNTIKVYLHKMAGEGIFGIKKFSPQKYLYALSTNVKFVVDKWSQPQSSSPQTPAA